MSRPQRKQLPFNEYESQWQTFWIKNAAFAAPNPGDPKFNPNQPKYYILDMFPYPSGEGLHVGHIEGYTATDILARYQRMRGFSVLHPMGWDAFGLPAEQYALKTGEHPRVTTKRNINHFRSQLQSLGFSYDWKREIDTTDPNYFKWTQWIFLQLYGSWVNPSTGKAEVISTYRGSDPDSVRLAYVAEMPVNWCPALGTVLANEEVVDGRSEVGGFPVERRPMRQWMLRITAYAQRLMEELEGLDWPESIKLLQRNWIGRSEGTEVIFQADSSILKVFTTRPDTLFGATYLVIAPEHPLVRALTTLNCKANVEAYCKLVSSKSDLDRTDLNKEKTGVFTGSFAINPVNHEKIPVWIADYVLMGYGTGAIMAVPAHDERDFEFATKFNLPIRTVVASSKPTEGCFVGEGITIHSPLIEGLPTAEAKKKITQWLEENRVGYPAIQYKLRDWLFSRQRYWGEPFPIIWEEGKHRPLEPTDLPICQPEMVDFKPTDTGEPPLARDKDWIRYSDRAYRETNTMPQWAGSCWYYLRFCDPSNSSHFVGTIAEQYWMGGGKPGGVDLYVGGTEHAVLHLLYARFWHKVLFDLGHVSTPEPFQRLVNQGIILGSDGHKMSKSRGNIVNPEHVIEEYGADSLRLYEMFMGPLEQMKPWSMKGVEGISRFLARVWRLAFAEDQDGHWNISSELAEQPLTEKQSRIAHATIKKVTSDLETLSFNTAISQMMIFTNEFTTVSPRPVEAVRILLRLLSPFAPHLAEEAWSRLALRFSGFESFASCQSWPEYNASLLLESEVELVVQVNGKVRGRIFMEYDAASSKIEAAALALPKVIETLGDQSPSRIIVVPNKLVNVVAP